MVWKSFESTDNTQTLRIVFSGIFSYYIKPRLVNVRSTDARLVSAVLLNLAYFPALTTASTVLEDSCPVKRHRCERILASYPNSGHIIKANSDSHASTSVSHDHKKLRIKISLLCLFGPARNLPYGLTSRTHALIHPQA